MAAPKLTKLEFQVMEALWGKNGAEQRDLSIREILEVLPSKRKPAYTTIQTTVYRMEAKGIVKRVRKVGNFHLFAAGVSRASAQHRMIDDLLAMFGGRPQPVMAHLVETGRLSLEDVKEAERTLRELPDKEKRS
jgi:BlaI family transcriptional regulator, penicillinase repressor